MKYMAARKYNQRRAFTFIEVLVTATAAVILIVGLSAMLFYGQRGYNTMYRRINSEVVRSANEARRIFDAIVRKSTVERCDILSPDDIYGEIYLYQYYDEEPPEPESFTVFRNLLADQGPADSSARISNKLEELSRKSGLPIATTPSEVPTGISDTNFYLCWNGSGALSFDGGHGQRGP